MNLMDEIKLIKPTIEYADDIMKYRQELLNSNDSLDGCGNLKSCLSADEWIKTINMLENEETCPKDKVTSNVFLAIRLTDKKIVGIIDFRHHINHPILSVWGGHIGYSVRPNERKKGYAKEMLRQDLQKCKDYGVDKVLITCNYDNIASEKTILANGGVFEKDIYVDGNRMKRYWIQL
jgi:predicted acetyltransferase